MTTISGDMVMAVLTPQGLDNVDTAAGGLLAHPALERYAPKARSVGSALRRAIRETVGDKIEVRPLKNGRGYLIARARSEGYGLGEDHSIQKEWSVALTPANTLEFSAVAPWEIRRALDAEFYRQCLGAGRGEVLDQIERILRDAGSVLVGGHAWVVAPATLDRLDQWSAAIGFNRSDMRGTLIIGRDADTLATVLSSFMDQFNHEVQKLQEMAVGQTGDRFWRGQEQRVEQARTRLRSVEALLGRALNGCHDTLTALAQQETVASVSAALDDF